MLSNRCSITISSVGAVRVETNSTTAVPPSVQLQLTCTCAPAGLIKASSSGVIRLHWLPNWSHTCKLNLAGWPSSALMQLPLDGTGVTMQWAASGAAATTCTLAGDPCSSVPPRDRPTV